MRLVRIERIGRSGLLMTTRPSPPSVVRYGLELTTVRLPDRSCGDAAGVRDQFAVLLPVPEQVLGLEHPTTLSTRATSSNWTKKADGDAEHGVK
jgi:hypothetical protein